MTAVYTHCYLYTDCRADAAQRHEIQGIGSPVHLLQAAGRPEVSHPLPASRTAISPSLITSALEVDNFMRYINLLTYLLTYLLISPTSRHGFLSHSYACSVRRPPSLQYSRFRWGGGSDWSKDVLDEWVADFPHGKGQFLGWIWGSPLKSAGNLWRCSARTREAIELAFGMVSGVGPQ